MLSYFLCWHREPRRYVPIEADSAMMTRYLMPGQCQGTYVVTWIHWFVLNLLWCYPPHKPTHWCLAMYCCIYGSSHWHMASDGLIHNLSKMIVIPGWAGDADSGGYSSWVRMHAYKTYSEYSIFKSTNVPVPRIQASSNQYFSMYHWIICVQSSLSPCHYESNVNEPSIAVSGIEIRYCKHCL